jgi:hypothetical protein
MKNGKNQAKTGSRDRNLESLLHQVLREDAKIFPMSDEDIRNLEAEVDLDGVEAIDPTRLLARVKGETNELKENIVPLFGGDTQTVESDMRAMAARNGGKITEQVQQTMDQDRDNAEKRHEKDGKQ